jgi:hypothetical protein
MCYQTLPRQIVFQFGFLGARFLVVKIKSHVNFRFGRKYSVALITSKEDGGKEGEERFEKVQWYSQQK